jgi:hypothetical protein
MDSSLEHYELSSPLRATVKNIHQHAKPQQSFHIGETWVLSSPGNQHPLPFKANNNTRPKHLWLFEGQMIHENER